MVTAFRSDNEVTNATAGTTVVVSKPSGIVDTGANPGRDHLVAFVATVGVTTITPPADWVLVTSAVDATNAVKLWCYRKLASSEGASWTWTLGSSVRNWGWVGAYTGVDPDDPVREFGTDLTLDSGTTLTLDSVIFASSHGQAIATSAAVRAASGAATTWESQFSGTERADLSTNAGAGTDISGAVADVQNTTTGAAALVQSFVASQSQTAGVYIALSLNPYFVPYTGGVGDAGLVLEAAEGVDPDSDSSLWTWTNLTSFVHNPAKVVLTHGRSNRSTVADPSRLTFSLLNINGEFTSPTGIYTSSMVPNLPFRVRLNGFGVDLEGTGYHRGTFFLASLRPRWDVSAKVSVVDIVAQGRLRRLQQRTDVLHSMAYTTIQRAASFTGTAAPVAHWPFEDESGSVSAASAVPDAQPARTSGVTFGVDTSVLGAAPLATLTSTSTIRATIPNYSDTGTWTAMFVANMPAEPAAATTLLEVSATGTARTWRAIITPGAPSSLTLQVFDGAGALILNTSVALTEVDFYAHPEFFTLTVTQDGTGVDYVLVGQSITGGVSGTIASSTCGRATVFRIGPAVGLDGVAFGHLALHVVPGADGGFSATQILTGNSFGGEFTWERFARLCQEQNVPYTYDGDVFSDVRMGRQTVNTPLSLLRECETAEGCVLNDSGVSQFTGETGLLWFPARVDRDNMTSTMTLNGASGQIAPPFEPALDDQDIVNDVEVSNVGGSTARVTDDERIATDGRYRELVTVNTLDDSTLRDMAGWRLNLGTAKGMRFPAVGWNLRRSPELAEQWMACRLFHRVDITNPPSQYPPDDIETVLEGYTETLSSDEWTVRANLSPFGPNKVFEIADAAPDTNPFVGRLTGDPDAAIRVAIDDNDTSIEFDPNRFRWTTVADHFDPDLRIRIGRAGINSGETADISSIATTAGTFVAAGAMSSADNAAVTPALYAGGSARDLICVLARIRSASAGTLGTPTGYTRLPIEGFDATSPMQLYAKVHTGSESDPTVTPTGGAAGDTVSAVTFGLRGTPSTLADLTDIVVDSRGQSNASAQNIAYMGLYPKAQEGCIVLALGGKDDDWTSVATLSGFSEAVDSSTITGNDQGLVVDYQIQTTPAVVNEGSFAVTGGASAVSDSIVVALAAGYQTMTVSARSVNGVVKSHVAGTKIEVEDAFVLE